VPVHYVGSERGVYFYAMQYVEGRSLAAVISSLRACIISDGTRGRPATTDQPTVDPADGQPVPATNSVSATTGVETAKVLDGLSTARSAKDATWFRTVARLGVEAAEALDHAHQHGVVHRDVKPANLLVDRDGHLWVADFGLAQVQSDAKLTLTGDLVGTLRYMSPEQALAQRVVVDHRTDVYSLGATLYELLTLEPVYTGTDRQELLRQISFEEPRLPRRLNRAIPAELETVVRKTLEKNPAERYATARELADDLRRFLEDKPIRAKRPSLTQRLGKWGRRNRGLVAAAVVLLLLTALGLAVSTILLGRANAETRDEWRRAEDNLEQARTAEAKAQEEQAKAEKETAKAKAVIRFLTNDLLGQADPYSGNPNGKMTVTDLLTQAAGKIDQAFPAQPEVEASVRETLGRVYCKLWLYAEAKPHLHRAVDLYRRTAGPDHEDTLRATNHLVEALHWLNRVDEAGSLGTQNLEACRRRLGLEHPVTLTAMFNMAGNFIRRGGRAEAVALYRQTVKGRLQLFGPFHEDTLESMMLLSDYLRSQHNFAEAEALARWDAEVMRKMVGAEDVRTLPYVHEISFILRDQGRLDEAEPLMRQITEVRHRTLGRANADTAHAIHTLADLLRRQGKPDEAEPLYREALEKYRLLGLKSQKHAPGAMRELAFVLKDLGKLDEAESLAHESLQTLRGMRPQDHADGLVSLGAILTAAGKPFEAEPLLREGLKIRRNVLPKGHWAVAHAESRLGGCLVALTRYAEAEPLMLTSYEALLKDEQVQPRVLREAHERLVKLYEAWDKPDEAQEWRAKGVPVKDQRVLREKWTAEMYKERQKLYRLFRETCPANAERQSQLAWIMATAFDPEVRDPQQAVELAKKAVELDPAQGKCWGTLGAALYRAGEPKAAVEALQTATQHRKDGNTFFFLAVANGQLGNRRQARTWYDQAVQWMEKNSPTDEELRLFRAEAATLLGIKDAPAGKRESPPAKQPGQRD
jgi:tetratricopeptide (TPR) repeat protein